MKSALLTIGVLASFSLMASQNIPNINQMMNGMQGQINQMMDMAGNMSQLANNMAANINNNVANIQVNIAQGAVNQQHQVFNQSYSLRTCGDCQNSDIIIDDNHHSLCDACLRYLLINNRHLICPVCNADIEANRTNLEAILQ